VLALCVLATTTSLVVIGGPASAANAVCSPTGSADVRVEGTDGYRSMPAADVREICLSSDGTTVLLTATMAPGSEPSTDRAALGSTTLRWDVSTSTIDGRAEAFVVLAAPGETTVSRAEGGPALCRSTEPMTDGTGFRSALPATCFPAAVTLNAASTLSFDDDPADPASPLYVDGGAWQQTGRIHNGLSTVDQRYVNLGGTRSRLGAAVGPRELAKHGTTERQRYETGLISWSADISPSAHEVVGPHYDLYRASGEEGGFLGRPTSGSGPFLNIAGEVTKFERGAIYWRPDTGAHEVHDEIARVYVGTGLLGTPSMQAPLGYPVTDQRSTPDGVGRYNHFENGSIYWSPATGAHPVVGDVQRTWGRLGWERSALGYPTSGPTTTRTFVKDPEGSYTDFQNGAIYSSPATDAREVRGAIRQSWSRLGGPSSALGFPTTDELGTPVPRGRFNHFQHGSVYWTPTTGAREVRGAIRSTWAARGWELGAVGYPVTDELGTPDGRGRFNHFEHGSIYWTPTTGAHEVRGAIRDRWARRTTRPTYSTGWERGPLGYPLTSELATPDGIGRFNHFERGSIYWHPASRTQLVYGGIRDYWASTGWEAGPLGYPLNEEGDSAGGRAQMFENGILFWDAATGKVSRR